ncbi:hypothetical protein HZS_3720 [Henneguya salminicola]|nr:hypothetical protein HZS_3720 [Henneguya salminicola]
MSSDHGSGHASAVNSVSDSWEDDVLIAAYNKAVSNLHKQKEKSVNENQYQTSNTSSTNNENTNYKIGDVIKARYYNDMKFYPAIIKSIDIDKFNVEFLDYGNCQLTFYYDIIKNKNTSDSEKETGEICSDEEETCINQNGIRGSSDSLSTPLPSIPLPQNVHKSL